MPADSTVTHAEAIALETSYWDALKRKDGKTAAGLSAASCIVAGSRGVTRIDKHEMAGMTEAGDWTLRSYAFEDMEVAMPAPGMFIIAYTVRQKVSIGGENKEFRAADVSIWVRGPTGWECHAHSESILGGDKP
jgi:hypothetical protein